MWFARKLLVSAFLAFAIIAPRPPPLLLWLRFMISM